MYDFRDVNIFLNDVEARVLGSLMEKETTTPEYYPLSLSALVNACNQKSNRDPLMNLQEDAVRQALRGLDQQALARSSASADSRVAKYEHQLQEVFNFDRRESAVFCVLLLRGPQTPGELRARAERMHRFDDLSEVQSILHRLMKRKPPLVKMLPRQPGTKEARYAHLLCGDVEAAQTEPIVEMPAVVHESGSSEAERVAQLEKRMAHLEKELAEVKQMFLDFRKKFE
jgi:uncharacterized protein YceH (UPF0502 family)